jgi:hypothetical protein
MVHPILQRRSTLMSNWKIDTIAILTILFLFACGKGQDDENFDDLIPPSQGKTDTGYLSNLAAELEGIFAGTLTIDLTDKTAEERNAYVEELKQQGWTLKSLINDQMKCAKNKVNAEKLHMNLSADEINKIEFTLGEDNILTIPYEIRLETIVTNKELEKAGLKINDLLDKKVDAKVPSNPQNLFTLIGEKCAAGFDAGGLYDYNYFYYFSSEKEGCLDSLVANKRFLTDATFTVKNPIAGKTVYPEYNRLRADNRIDVVAFFGAAEHDWEPGKWDWGVSGYEDFVRWLKDQGFQEEPIETGKRFHRKKANLDEYVDVISPEVLKLLKDDTDGLFKAMVKTHEIIFYNGHSFYGSLSVLREKDVYPPDTYQIFFMNSCWSYEYYTKQVFEAKITDTDPVGWALADVVNNTEPGWFHHMAMESRILLTNLLAGAESGGIDGDRYYTWDRIIGKMNEYASRGDVPEDKSGEVFGVSGVTSNIYEPQP